MSIHKLTSELEGDKFYMFTIKDTSIPFESRRREYRRHVLLQASRCERKLWELESKFLNSIHENERDIFFMYSDSYCMTYQHYLKYYIMLVEECMLKYPELQLNPYYFEQCYKPENYENNL